MGNDQLAVVRRGLGYAEAPRWHEGELWFSDFITREVHSLDSDGLLTARGYIPGQPSGLGFAADGTPLVVSMFDRRLIELRDGERHIRCDLSGIATSTPNDMVVAPDGTAYVGTIGFEPSYRNGGTEGPGAIIMVRPDGSAHLAADGLTTPNGMALTPDGQTLVVAETRGRRLTAFDVAPDGCLQNPRLWAGCGESSPDGIVMDAEGHIWLGSPFNSRFIRIARGGEVLAVLETPGRRAIACALGGADRRQLFCLTARTNNQDLFEGRSTAAIEVVTVACPGF
ncbi:SMP-30/gluconolactonase/LRE family protein [Mycobacterium sp. NAZ190054]|uniref:SMP-30/gluconolactonase/LRE family protein n=1 Tax=Mycobacterium sp. NAZ190054 TaxID=1747766 RepID=UPI000794E4E1|nr:SMP-30/gluconolactonase/LRE family protein [Mycobacterium sp. NAZ190054]KWX69269.1 hypothetical protein ASJ79_00275 [Mycobacterium sp. NAZ190054]